ncbi:MAG: hypothetical protein K2K56_09265 [Lachnospiraceae bacterium]|nr:hypothetical protein [Lachnospiraceae bacterium]
MMTKVQQNHIDGSRKDGNGQTHCINKWLSPQMKMAIEIIEEHTKVDLV